NGVGACSKQSIEAMVRARPLVTLRRNWASKRDFPMPASPPMRTTGDAVLRGTFNSLPIFYGTVRFNYNLAPFVPAAMTTNCPSSYTVAAGASSTIVTIPAPVYPAQSPGCTVTFTTLPPGAGGSFYTQVIGF
ncbi:MAG: hypothetical protein ABI186_03550, partial [Candidatus Elarobacter sp.]